MGYDEALVRRVVRMVDRNEYKRRQAPPGVKITPRAFGRDRRLPIANRLHVPRMRRTASHDHPRHLIFDYGGVILDMRWDVSAIARARPRIDRAARSSRRMYSRTRLDEVERRRGDRERGMRRVACAAGGARAEGRCRRCISTGARAAPDRAERRTDPAAAATYRTACSATPTGRCASVIEKCGVARSVRRVRRARREVGMAKPEPRIYELAARAPRPRRVRVRVHRRHVSATLMPRGRPGCRQCTSGWTRATISGRSSPSSASQRRRLRVALTS